MSWTTKVKPLRQIEVNGWGPVQGSGAVKTAPPRDEPPRKVARLAYSDTQRKGWLGMGFRGMIRTFACDTRSPSAGWLSLSQVRGSRRLVSSV